MKPKKHFYYGLNVSLNIKYLAKSQSMIKNSFLSRLATNGFKLNSRLEFETLSTEMLV